jgi:hypothetical protein
MESQSVLQGGLMTGLSFAAIGAWLFVRHNGRLVIGIVLALIPILAAVWTQRCLGRLKKARVGIIMLDDVPSADEIMFARANPQLYGSLRDYDQPSVRLSCALRSRTGQ